MEDFLIIGGGIIGMLTARELASDGARVTLVDKSETGTESSWAGGGIISPLYPWRYADSVTRLAGWSQAYYPGLCEDLTERSGVDPEYTRSGLLILDTDEAGPALSWAQANEVRLIQLGGKETGRSEPGLTGGPEGALWLPEVAQVRNPRLVRSARLALNGLIDIEEQSEALGLLIKNGRAEGIRTPQGTYKAGNIIVCAGAWTAELLAQLGTKPDILPVLGQMILFYAKANDVKHIVLHKDHYLIPRRDGRILMGSTVEHTGFEKTTTQLARDELRQLAVEMFPILRHAPIEHHWAGLRPGSPSGIPYIGAYPGIEGLYFNAGHFRNGVVLGPASARLMADIALQRAPIVDPTPYALGASRA